jgi:hypothetical protein
LSSGVTGKEDPEAVVNLSALGFFEDAKFKNMVKDTN